MPGFALAVTETSSIDKYMALFALKAKISNGFALVAV